MAVTRERCSIAEFASSYEPCQEIPDVEDSSLKKRPALGTVASAGSLCHKTRVSPTLSPVGTVARLITVAPCVYTPACPLVPVKPRSEEHTSELQSPMYL